MMCSIDPQVCYAAQKRIRNSDLLAYVLILMFILYNQYFFFNNFFKFTQIVLKLICAILKAKEKRNDHLINKYGPSS